MLAKHGIALDAVIELRVDEAALIRRIESRIAEMQARGEPLRPDDNPDILHRRLLAYRELTAPLIAYYGQHGVLQSVDGMAPIDEVAADIEKKLSAKAQARRQSARRQSPRQESDQESDQAEGRPSRKKPEIGKKSKARRAKPRKPVRSVRKAAASKSKIKPKARTKARAKVSKGRR